MLRVNAKVIIDDAFLSETFVRSSGPGGQNVNKVSTAVRLRFDLKSCPALSVAIRERVASLAGSRMTVDGVLVIVADRFRTRERNRADARERLVRMILRALVPPIPRRPTKPTSSSRLKRLDSKKVRSAKKAARRAVERD